MKTIRVTYTTRADFSGQNQENIRAVMNDLEKAGHAGLHYHACMAADNKTFVHTAFFRTDEDQKILTDLPSFRHFQEQLKSSGPESPPKQEVLTLIGASSVIFK